MKFSLIVFCFFFLLMCIISLCHTDYLPVISDKQSTNIVGKRTAISLNDVKDDCQKIEKILSGRDWLTDSFKIESMSKSRTADSVSYPVQFYLPIYSSLRNSYGHYRINGQNASGVISDDPIPYEKSLIAFDRKFLPQNYSYDSLVAFDRKGLPPMPKFNLDYNDISRRYHEFDRNIDASWGSVTIEDGYSIKIETHSKDFFNSLGLRFKIYTKYRPSSIIVNESKLHLSLNGHKVYLTIDACSTDKQFEMLESVEDDLRLIFSGAIYYGLDRNHQFIVESISLINIVSNELLFSYGIAVDA